MKQSELGRVIPTNKLPLIATAEDPQFASRIPVGSYQLLKDLYEAKAIGDGKPWPACVLRRADGEVYQISPRVLQGIGRQNGKTVRIHTNVPCYGNLVQFAATEPKVEITEYVDYMVDEFGKDTADRAVAMPHFAITAVNNSNGKKGKK